MQQKCYCSGSGAISSPRRYRQPREPYEALVALLQRGNPRDHCLEWLAALHVKEETARTAQALAEQQLLSSWDEETQSSEESEYSDSSCISTVGEGDDWKVVRKYGIARLLCGVVKAPLRLMRDAARQLQVEPSPQPGYSKVRSSARSCVPGAVETLAEAPRRDITQFRWFKAECAHWLKAECAVLRAGFSALLPTVMGKGHRV